MGADVFFVLIGAILVFAMHGGFAFLEVGTVQHKNQVNALVKILVDFALSTLAYFFVGYAVAYGVTFFVSATVLSGAEGDATFPLQGFALVKFFFLTTFAAAIPAIISGGIAERMKFLPQCLATAEMGSGWVAARRSCSLGWCLQTDITSSSQSPTISCPYGS